MVLSIIVFGLIYQSSKLAQYRKIKWIYDYVKLN